MRFAWIGIIACASVVWGEDFVDPAPPRVQDVTAAGAPRARVQEELTFHGAPRALASGAVVEDWPSFLGPRHNGVSGETKLLKAFPKEGPAVVWEVEKGEGYAAPAVVGERLILFHRVGDEEVVECLHAERGERFWKFSYPTDYVDRYGYNGGPRCAPSIDDGRVYTYGVQGKLHCLDLLTGQVIWRRDLMKEFNAEPGFFGVGATPLVEGDVVVINVGAPKGPSVVGLDKKTGRMVWGAGKDWGASYAAPVPADVHGKRRVFVFAGGESRPPVGGLICIDPTNGKIDFEFPWRGTRYESVNASAPVVIGNQVFISECYGAGSALVDVLPDGSAKLAWTNADFGTHFMTAIHQDGYLYGVHGHGPLNSPLVCIDLKTGKDVWRNEPRYVETVKRGDAERQVKLMLARASLVRADGRFLCLGEFGHLLWLELTPNGYRQLSRSWLFFAGETWTGPVISKGLLYVCQNQEDAVTKKGARLICYDIRGE